MHIIYGGTFDPVHHGHLRTAVELREHFGVAQLALVPCHIPPHRGSPDGSSEQRLGLLQLAIADESGLIVDDRELRREQASYTAETLRELRRELGPGESLAMVVGTDAFAAFDRWREWQQIPELAHIILVQRPGAGLSPGSAPHSLLESRRAQSAEELHQRPAGLVLEVSPPLLDISATAIRERIAKGLSARYLLPDPVLAEIRRLGLYRAPLGR